MSTDGPTLFSVGRDSGTGTQATLAPPPSFSLLPCLPLELPLLLAEGRVSSPMRSHIHCVCQNSLLVAAQLKCRPKRGPNQPRERKTSRVAWFQPWLCSGFRSPFVSPGSLERMPLYHRVTYLKRKTHYPRRRGAFSFPPSACRYSGPLSNTRVGGWPQCSVKSAYNLQWAICIHSSTSVDSTNHGSCSSVLFPVEKYSHVSGPTQFKPMLFKGQLYSGIPSWPGLPHIPILTHHCVQPGGDAHPVGEAGADPPVPHKVPLRYPEAQAKSAGQARPQRLLLTLCLICRVNTSSVSHRPKLLFNYRQRLACMKYKAI